MIMLKTFCVLLIFAWTKTSAINEKNQTCSNANSTPGQDYCLSELPDYKCYVDNAITFALNGIDECSLWVELCVFSVPDYFLTNQYNCNIGLPSGPVVCEINETQGTADKNKFTSHCNLIMLWKGDVCINSVLDGDYQRIRNLALEKCSINKEWKTSDVVFFSDRYLFKHQANFSKHDVLSSAWTRITINEWPKATLVSVVSMVVVVFLFVILTFYCGLKRMRKKYDTWKQKNVEVMAQITAVLNSPTNIGIENTNAEKIDELRIKHSMDVTIL